MLRAPFLWICRLLLRIFFRSIEVVGEHRLPPRGSLIFTANHHNGLIDPLLLLCLPQRRVSFLAKEPLFRMPVIGWFVRSFESLPVHRAQDGADPTKNRALFQAAVELLERGNALGLFPEGVSHNEPELKPFRSGAARIALAARALGEGEVYLVPCFLYYEQKQSFRSRAVLAYGEPLSVPRLELNERGEPPREHVVELTAELRQRISQIAPTAKQIDALLLAEKAERLLTAETERPPAESVSLAKRMKERRRLIDAYSSWISTDPEHVTPLLQRLEALLLSFERAGLPIDARAGLPHPSRKLYVKRLQVLVLALPATVGLLLHAPAYQLIHRLATRYSGAETDVLATAKLLGGFLLFPLTWLCLAGLLGANFGWLAFFSAWLIGPGSGLSALWFRELLGFLERQRKARQLLSSQDFQTLARERRELARAIQSALTTAARP